MRWVWLEQPQHSSWLNLDRSVVIDYKCESVALLRIYGRIEGEERHMTFFPWTFCQLPDFLYKKTVVLVVMMIMLRMTSLHNFSVFPFLSFHSWLWSYPYCSLFLSPSSSVLSCPPFLTLVGRVISISFLDCFLVLSFLLRLFFLTYLSGFVYSFPNSN